MTLSPTVELRRLASLACLLAAVVASAPEARAGGVGGTGPGGSGGGGAGGGGGTMAPCAHDTCTTGEALAPDCDACVTKVCAADAYCCEATGSWDTKCVTAAETQCGLTCVSCNHDGRCDGIGGEDCACDDCEGTALCVPDQCVNNGACTLDDACICKDCHEQEYCSDPCNCNNDGTCDSFNEGCACADCNPSKAECTDAKPPGVCDPPTGAGGASSSSGAVSTGSFGASSAGPGAATDDGCTCRVGAGDHDVRTAAAFALACAALASLLGRRSRRA